MARFIVRFRGAGPPPEEQVKAISSSPILTVVDRSSPRMFLVEGVEVELRALLAGMPDWVLAPERFVPLPDLRRKPRT
jgi:hypothetical protein